jgi:DNA-directed RNA polymerase II subunit RPB1
VCCKSDPNFADKIRHVRDLKTRMAIVWNHCKSKMVCEADEQRDEGDLDGDEPKKGHGGCGHLQPLIRKEGLKLFLQYKKAKDEDEVCDCRISLHRTLTCFRI